MTATACDAFSGVLGTRRGGGQSATDRTLPQPVQLTDGRWYWPLVESHRCRIAMPSVVEWTSLGVIAPAEASSSELYRWAVVDFAHNAGSNPTGHMRLATVLPDKKLLERAHKSFARNREGAVEVISSYGTVDTFTVEAALATVRDTQLAPLVAIPKTAGR